MNTKSYILISLFNGCGGASLALKNQGVNVIKTYVSEIDKNANKVYSHHFPSAIQLGDVTKITEEQILYIKDEAKKANAEIILVGGSPCQNLSFAGTQKGLSTTCNIDILSLEQYLSLKENNFEFNGQSYLFWEYVRILNILKPKWYLLENVKMLDKWAKVFDEIMPNRHIEIDSGNYSPQTRVRYYWSNIKPNLNINRSSLRLIDIIDKSVPFLAPNDYLLGFWNKKQRLSKVRNINRKSNTLTTEFHRVESYMKNNKNKTRQYTIGECEILQGLPKGYTSLVKKTGAMKMIGNGFQIQTIELFIRGIKDGTENIKQKNLFDFA